MARTTETHEVWCSRNHRVASYSSESCDGGHVHLIYRCRMRLGNAPHGELAAVIPPYSDSCEPEVDNPDEEE